MEDLCIDCGKVVTNRHQALMCEPCDRWQHRRCNTGISQYAYREGVRNGTPVEWTCSECLESARLEEMREMAAYIEGASAGYEFCPNLHSTALSASSPPASPFSSPPRSPMSVTSPMSISSPPVSPSFTSPPISPSPPQLSLPTSPASPSPPVSPIQRSLPTSPASPSPPVSPLPALPNISNTFALDPAIFTPPRHEEISLDHPTPNDVDIDTDAPIKTYEIVEGGTQRRGKMLVDSAGYSYTMKRAGKKITLWICSVRSKCLWCKATVQQKGDTFVEEPCLALVGLDVHHSHHPTCNTSRSISDTLNEIFSGTLWASVPKSRRSLERRMTRRMTGKKHYGEHAKLKQNLVACLECGSWKEIQSICGKCYEKVREETKVMQEAMSDEAKFYAPQTETAFLYKGEEDDRPKYKGKYIVEMDRPRPSWFPRNLMTKTNE